jgi:hypothetical protein
MTFEGHHCFKSCTMNMGTIPILLTSGTSLSKTRVLNQCWAVRYVCRMMRDTHHSITEGRQGTFNYVRQLGACGGVWVNGVIAGK